MSQKTKRRRLQATIDALRKDLETCLQNRNTEKVNASMEISMLRCSLARWMATHDRHVPIRFDRLPSLPGYDAARVRVVGVDCLAVLVDGNEIARSSEHIKYHVSRMIADRIINDDLITRIDDPEQRRACFAIAVGKWEHPEGTKI